MAEQSIDPGLAWPRLRTADWAGTRDTLHLWTQIVGKIRMAHAPAVNHWWHVTLYVTPRGLTTSTIPYGDRAFEIEFDLVDHQLQLRTSEGRQSSVALEPKPVADFYAETMDALDGLGLSTRIHATPNEVDPAIPFAQDTQHASYDPHAVELYRRQLLQANRALTTFRSGFVGKVSPVHFFWGAMDLACTRFSGRTAPRHPGGAPNCPPSVMHEGYSHELASCGFWPGGGDEGAFYAYAYPEPDGYAGHPVGPAGTTYADGEFLLPYEAVASASDPEGMLAEFFETTYRAAADLEAGTGRRSRPASDARGRRSGDGERFYADGMSAYVIAHLQDAAPHPDVAEYIERISGTFEPYGGRFLVHATRHEVKEGSWPGGVVMIGFPGLAEARGWWDSPEYQEIAPLRSRHIDGDIIMIDGVPEGYDPTTTAASIRAAALAAE